MAGGEEPLYHVTPELAKQTLAAALRTWLPGRTWNQIRKLVEDRQVTVCGNLCLDPARRLKAGDPVRVLPKPALPPPKAHDVEVVYSDTHVIVVEKPPGLTTVRHPEEAKLPARRRQVQPTLDELMPRILSRHETPGKRGGAPGRIRPVHRLDRDTSGLLIFARTEAAERHLGHQFRLRTIHRRYLAVAVGRVEAQTIESRLVINRGDGRRGSTTFPDVGQEATTHVRPVEFLEGYTLVECRLETGRTHQIRIHLSERGHPVAGDRVYHQPLHAPPIPDVSGAARLALHAAELGFEHPETGKHMRFDSPLPADMQELVERWRKRS
ncbi:MAG TPA: RluA family pseudouridine synthase [Planctomycetia bacterium]|jgi:23S rRNA pseudouridine1911/1915/1917 synthase|nr:RluA family pseudouridine synthase [Planctomycetia bacterium]